jgi:hypothetical protein
MFKPGQSGNKKGRPPNIITRKEFRAIVGEQHLEAIIKRLTAEALNGDMTAAKLILEKTYPSLRAIDHAGGMTVAGLPEVVYKITKD